MGRLHPKRRLLQTLGHQILVDLVDGPDLLDTTRIVAIRRRALLGGGSLASLQSKPFLKPGHSFSLLTVSSLQFIPDLVFQIGT